MPSEVILPRVDMDMATGKISKWLVDPGTTVTKGQPLFEIETDKATMEIEAESTGIIRDLAAAGATDIPVGSVVAWIFAADEAHRPNAAPSPEPATFASMPEAPKAECAVAAPPASAPEAMNGRCRATPLARRLARNQGIDLRSVNGSGPRGRIQAADVAAAPRPADPHPVATPPMTERSADGARRADPASVPATVPLAGPASLRRLRDGTGRPVLLVHGFGAEAASWRPFLQSLPLGRPVFGLDLPGHGDAPLDGVATFDDLVEYVGTSLAALDSADVAAHSLGAAVMAAVAARGLADIRSLLLIAPAGLGPEINGGFIQGFLDANSEAALAPWMRELVTDPRDISPAFVRSTLKRRAGGDGLQAQRHLAMALFPGGTQGFSTRDDLARLRVPTRVVFGTADKIIPPRHAAALPPLVALHLLPGIGHMPQIEAPDLMTKILSYALQV